MKDKIINFILVFLLVFLTLQLFSGKNQPQQAEGISLIMWEKYTVPASIIVNIKNNTSKNFVFNTCDDFKISQNSLFISPSECQTISLHPGKQYKIDFSSEYEKFIQEWTYFVRLKTSPEEEIFSQFQVKYRWFIGKFFVYFFYAPIYNLVAFLLQITGYSLWFAIVLVTIIIRLFLLYPQHKMMVSQARLQQIQPQIKEIQEKYKWNHQMLGVELMNLYKKENVNPMGSCWMLLIQMPILIVIYRVILGIQDNSNIYYLYSFIGDYSLDKIQSIFYGINLFGQWGLHGLILAIIVGWLQYIQVKLSLYFQQQKQPKWVILEKKKDEKDYSNFMPDPDMLNKFMLYGMPLMIAFVTYTFHAWVGIYWWIGTLFMIIQQLIVNKILKK